MIYRIPVHIRAIIFDLDNTLVDAKKAERIAALKMLEENQEILGPQDPEAFAARWHEITVRHYHLYEIGRIDQHEQRRRRMREIMGNDLLSDEQADHRYDGYRRHFEKHWILYPDVLECLERLGDYKKAVVSNGEKEQQLLKMSKLGLKKHFISSVFPGDTGTFKPDPGMFLKACGDLGTPPELCLSIGDNIEIDINPCRKLKMEALLIDREKRAEYDGSFRIVSSLSDIRGQ